jgi:hypothetical protein
LGLVAVSAEGCFAEIVRPSIESRFDTAKTHKRHVAKPPLGAEARKRVAFELEIESALNQLLEFLDFDRSNFGEFTADGWPNIFSNALYRTSCACHVRAESHVGFRMGQQNRE